MIFGNSQNKYCKKDYMLANRILNIMSETLRKSEFDDFLFLLTDTISKIENKYPNLFKEAII
ncbi:MAG: hypothetical protein KGD63_00575 [Candidatus Lokiarchaeota archaeon]|nr:hypothetical protein [Candidatus Lokiarchaeota archaeon]